MGSILDLIDKICERPSLYLGRPSASTLYAYLTGYAYARQEAGQADYDFLAEFNQWVHDHYEVTSTQSWAKIVEFYSASEMEEMTLFGKLLDDYLAKRKAGRGRMS